MRLLIVRMTRLIRLLGFLTYASHGIVLHNDPDLLAEYPQEALRPAIFHVGGISANASEILIVRQQPLHDAKARFRKLELPRNDLLLGN